MNDRIKELIKHTDIWCDQNVASESPTYNNQWEYKFAELIIQECARVARATPAPNFHDHLKQQLGHNWDIACAQAGSEIIRYFGINK
jgi:hypothetical protein